MKTVSTSRQILLAVATLCLAATGIGCTKDQMANNSGAPAERRRIPLAPVSTFSPGIGAPGAGSADTRGTGTVATGQGDTPLADPDTGSVPVSGAGNTPGTRRGVPSSTGGVPASPTGNTVGGRF